AKACEAVAVVTGAGNVRLFASLGAGRVIEGGPTMNPSTQEILDAIEASTAGEAVVLPNNRNVVMSADQAAALAGKPVCVVRTESIQAGLAAMVAYDPARTAEANAVEMHEALEGLATGAIAISSKAAEVDGVHVREGAYLGRVATKAVASGESFDEVACAVADRLLSEPRELLTLVVGETEPDLAALIEHLSQRHPLVELDVQVGGQPHYPLLLSVE
nr:hypothetical protein [Actinomycetota bacterium]